MPLTEGNPDCLRVAGVPSSFYVLRDGDALYLMDAGCFGAGKLLATELKEAGWDHLPIRGILVTHGHFDHILNVGKMARDAEAWIAGAPGDAARFAGEPRVAGIGRPLAAVERWVFRLPRFVPFTPDRWIQDGDSIDIWGGLRAVHLPGHTAGHTGFFSQRHGLLFCADLFASFRGLSHFPPAVFNEDRAEMLRSTGKALAIEGLTGLLPHHSDGAAPGEHLRRLREFAARHGISAPQR